MLAALLPQYLNFKIIRVATITIMIRMITIIMMIMVALITITMMIKVAIKSTLPRYACRTVAAASKLLFSCYNKFRCQQTISKLEKVFNFINQKYMNYVSIYLKYPENVIENISPSIKAIDLEIGIWSGSAKCTPTYFFNCNKYTCENSPKKCHNFLEEKKNTLHLLKKKLFASQHLSALTSMYSNIRRVKSNNFGEKNCPYVSKIAILWYGFRKFLTS